MIALALFLTLVQPSDAKETPVAYHLDGKEFEGFMVKPKPTSKSGAAVLIIHDWMGLTEKTKAKARQVASLGYTAFAAGIYGKGIRPKDQKEAGALAGKYKGDRTLFRAHLTAALEALKGAKGVSAKNISAIGFCFGGTGVVELARTGAEPKGIVSFHGGLDSPEPALGKNIKAKVLALHGADDPYVPAADLAAFESEMRDNKIDWQLIKYGGAVHSFTDKTAGTDNSKGAAYNEKADARSWVAMKEFLAGALASPSALE